MEDSLPKVVKGRSKRLGRGYGSGKGGHTVGRGQKGQKSRKDLNILFEGVKVKKSLIKRLPLQPGKGRLKPKQKPLIIKLALLNILPTGSKVNIDSLDKYGVVKKEELGRAGVKILGNGQIKKKLTVSVPVSKSAAKKIVKAGGKVESSREEKKVKVNTKARTDKDKSVKGRSKL